MGNKTKEKLLFKVEGDKDVIWKFPKDTSKGNGQGYLRCNAIVKKRSHTFKKSNIEA